MALLFAGKTECGICGRVIASADEAVSFPAFSSWETDPLILFSDSSFHSTCFESHPLRGRVEAVIAELFRRSGPGHRACAVCGAQVLHHDELVMIPRLVDDERHPVARFHYAHLHRSHARDWTELQAALAALRALEAERAPANLEIRKLIQLLTP